MSDIGQVQGDIGTSAAIEANVTFAKTIAADLEANNRHIANITRRIEVLLDRLRGPIPKEAEVATDAPDPPGHIDQLCMKRNALRSEIANLDGAVTELENTIQGETG